jgi:hypothetical protein
MEQSTILGLENQRKKEYNKVVSFFLNFIFFPLRAGLFGFSAFFTTVLLVKYMGTLIDNNALFLVDLTDIYLSSLGFFLIFTIRILENFREKK